MKKVLLYNWCPLADTEGGGIALYMRNVTNYLKDKEKDIVPIVVNSGFYYDGSNQVYYREETVNEILQLSIVNSPVFAPMRAPASNFEAMLNEADLSLKMIFISIIEKYGPFDAIHFQTFEGLSLNVLTIKDIFPKIQFVYSLHNYTLFCPNVMLWREEGRNCYKDVQTCRNCMSQYQIPSVSFLKKSRELITNHDEKKLYYYSRGVKFITRKTIGKIKRKSAFDYESYIKSSVTFCNKYIDCILAVSKKVGEIAAYYGVNPQKIQVSYIGTAVAETARTRPIAEAGLSPLGVLYMGYMREEKGFYFYLSALEKLKDEVASDISLTFATKVTDYSAKKRIEKLKKKYASVRLYNGYTHDQFEEILQGQHVGVVPVLWEDNLPQVAIEMIANGAAVLASDFGGASELSGNPDFTFAGGDEYDFNRKLMNIYNNRNLLEEYWEKPIHLTTMQQHINSLKRIYTGADNDEG